MFKNEFYIILHFFMKKTNDISQHIEIFDKQSFNLSLRNFLISEVKTNPSKVVGQ